jgi:hypothetical protein
LDTPEQCIVSRNQCYERRANMAACGNCGAVVTGAYCAGCGQDTKVDPPTVAEYVHDLIDHSIHLDRKVWKTFWPLLLRPGKVADDYLANKRACYIKPLKLYLAVIAIAFAMVQFFGWDLGLRFGLTRPTVSLYLVQKSQPRTAVSSEQIRAESNPLALDYVRTSGILHLKALPREQQLQVPHQRGIHYLPYLTLALVPIYAVLLMWIYARRRMRFGAHMIFALYLHSFFLIVFVMEAKLPLVMATMLSLWAVAYSVMALRRVYGGTWGETILRGTALTLSYAIVAISAGFLAAIMLLSF